MKKNKRENQTSLEKDFLSYTTLDLAPRLLGCILETDVGGIKTSGMIVEVEAYDGRCDEAAHCFRGKTTRTEVMFKSPGHVYVYLIYGMYYCVNFVTEDEGIGAALLIRALEPIDGIETMKERRKTDKLNLLCKGPGRLCQAMGIDKQFNNEYLFSSEIIKLYHKQSFKEHEIGTSPRIGIQKALHLDWRFFVKGSQFVS